jgi:hypothetical protein
VEIDQEGKKKKSAKVENAKNDEKSVQFNAIKEEDNEDDLDEVRSNGTNLPRLENLEEI